MDEQREINQEDSWTVISAHFEEKGLVGQQLDSFNEFLTNTIQELIDDSPPIELYPQAQHVPGEELDEEVRTARSIFFKNPQLLLGRENSDNCNYFIIVITDYVGVLFRILFDEN